MSPDLAAIVDDAMAAIATGRDGDPAVGALAELLKRYRVLRAGFVKSVVDDDLLRFYGPEVHAITVDSNDVAEIMDRLEVWTQGLTEPTWSVVGLLTASEDAAAVPLIVDQLVRVPRPLTPQHAMMVQSLLAGVRFFLDDDGVRAALQRFENEPGSLGAEVAGLL
jgi:hypothetical protein